MLKIAKRALDGEKVLAQPKDRKRYYKAPGYLYASYPSVSFTHDGRVILLYAVSDFGTVKLPVGIKVRILPISWFYEK